MQTDANAPQILCCLCGRSIQANPANMCLDCIQGQVDVTQDIKTDAIIVNCRGCERWLTPPKYWGPAALESKELLTLCLKRIKGLEKLKVMDAVFLWTEPHSKTLKVKLTVQKEIFTNVMVQQNTVVHFTITNQMCDHCTKLSTGQEQWQAVVQARQKAAHKRTFLYLEQLILAAGMHSKCTKVSEQPDGLDFFYDNKSAASHMVDFLGSKVPIRFTKAEQLVSADLSSNVANIKHAFAVEICPICREDLVVLPKAYYTSMGGFGPLALCVKIGTHIVLMEPHTIKVSQIPGNLYWKQPFGSYGSSRSLHQLYILDIECEWNSPSNGKYKMADVQVCKVNEIGKGKIYCGKTHLGNHLQPGDYAMGYLLEELVANESLVDKYKNLQLPDVVLVRKFYPTQVQRRNKRKWKIQHIAKDTSGLRDNTLAKREAELQEFLDDLERDPELRADVNLFLDDDAKSAITEATNNEEDVPKVSRSELLRPGQTKAAATTTLEEDEDDEEWEEDEEEDDEMEQ
eukprot:TRINITY_DN47143_c0_g1_i1.p1 TRINITY_DN47143_c0_g1~~TRINITY_DN47143_c0_g1_i1.p1  ORF type:complete len:524 (-),score=58.23 TRINITY_DN47143_c0_g1_i1:1647-3191(-)